MRKMVSFVAALALLFALASQTIAAPVPALCKVYGVGTAANPYRLCDANSFELLRTKPSAHFILATHIDFKGALWMPPQTFSGTFDGRGQMIQNVLVDHTEHGFFGNLNTGTIRNLTFIKTTIKGVLNTGGVATINKGTISNVKFHGDTSSYRGLSAGYSVINDGLIENGYTSGVRSAGGYSTGTGVVHTNNGKIMNTLNASIVHGVYGAAGYVNTNNGLIQRADSWGGTYPQVSGAAFVLLNSETGQILDSKSSGNLYYSKSFSPEIVKGFSDFVGTNTGTILRSQVTGKLIAQ